MLFLGVLVRQMSRRRMPPLTQRDATLICCQQSTLVVVKLEWRDHVPLRQSEAVDVVPYRRDANPFAAG
jgi:hypothetical protein